MSRRQGLAGLSSLSLLVSLLLGWSLTRAGALPSWSAPGPGEAGQAQVQKVESAAREAASGQGGGASGQFLPTPRAAAGQLSPIDIPAGPPQVRPGPAPERERSRTLPGQLSALPGEALGGQASISTLEPLQGSTLVLWVRASQAPHGQLGQQAVSFAPEGELFVGLASIAPWEAPGPLPLVLSYLTPGGQEGRLQRTVEVSDARFPLERWPASGGGVPEYTREQIVAERERLQGIVERFGEERQWTGPFDLPLRDGYRLTSPFGIRRAFGEAPARWWHEGLDMAAPVGTPVYASAPGVVVLAEPLHVRGNAVILYHGWAVYTGYWHLSALQVEAGQRVEQGQLIGRVGSSGFSTGPHLHWEVRVNGLYVDPGQWLETAIP